jgi:hypothetical protein
LKCQYGKTHKQKTMKTQETLNKKFENLNKKYVKISKQMDKVANSQRYLENGTTT